MLTRSSIQQGRFMVHSLPSSNIAILLTPHLDLDLRISSRVKYTSHLVFFYAPRSFHLDWRDVLSWNKSQFSSDQRCIQIFSQCRKNATERSKLQIIVMFIWLLLAYIFLVSFEKTRRTPEKFRQLDKVLRLIFEGGPVVKCYKEHRITKSRLVDQQTLRGSGSGPLFPGEQTPEYPVLRRWACRWSSADRVGNYIRHFSEKMVMLT